MVKIIFKETQRLKLLLIIAIIFTLLFGVILFIQVIMGKPVGSHPAPNVLLIVFFTIGVLGSIFSGRLKLLLVIHEGEIHVSYGIFTGDNKYKLNEIKALKGRKYDALKEFWGWGVRYNNNESCFTVSGDDALEIELKNGEKILIGTQKPDEIMSAIAMLLQNS
ncbi:hypothetical protein [Mucilaginibacter sp.]